MREVLKGAISKASQLIKFGISGAIAALITISLLYFFTDILKIWYLLSSVIAYATAITINFFMQKFWAFGGDHQKKISRQFVLFFSINLINLFLNTDGLYLLVDKIKLFYITAQILMAVILALISFTFYKFLIFKKQETAEN